MTILVTVTSTDDATVTIQFKIDYSSLINSRWTVNATSGFTPLDTNGKVSAGKIAGAAYTRLYRSDGATNVAMLNLIDQDVAADATGDATVVSTDPAQNITGFWKVDSLDAGPLNK